MTTEENTILEKGIKILETPDNTIKLKKKDFKVEVESEYGDLIEYAIYGDSIYRLEVLVNRLWHFNHTDFDMLGDTDNIKVEECDENNMFSCVLTVEKNEEQRFKKNLKAAFNMHKKTSSFAIFEVAKNARDEISEQLYDVDTQIKNLEIKRDQLTVKKEEYEALINQHGAAIKEELQKAAEKAAAKAAELATIAKQKADEAAKLAEQFA